MNRSSERLRPPYRPQALGADARLPHPFRCGRMHLDYPDHILFHIQSNGGATHLADRDQKPLDCRSGADRKSRADVEGRC
jgi:hypothetical protein